jgi:TPP-dependent pyruvate/acetoin dehydrogenase alpha subunit
LVWEKWPELFVPRSSGSIQPNANIWGISVSISGVSINNGMDVSNFKKMVEDAVVWASRKVSLWSL